VGGLKAKGGSLVEGYTTAAGAGAGELRTGAVAVSGGRVAVATVAVFGKSKLTAMESAARAGLAKPIKVLRPSRSKLRRRRMNFMDSRFFQAEI
jgi:hypothetical protein